jgi:hypothetical protein
MKDMLVSNRGQYVWHNRAVPANWGAITRRIVNAMEVSHRLAEFSRLSSLQLYQRLSASPRPEKWLDRTDRCKAVRIKVLLRANCAPVYDAVGPRNNVPRPNRNCILCEGNSVEDVKHFVAVCSRFDEERKECLRRIDMCLLESGIPSRSLSMQLATAIRERSHEDLVQLFLGDLFHGLPDQVYRKLHSAVFNYLTIIWKKRDGAWTRFCRNEDPWSLVGTEQDIDG